MTRNILVTGASGFTGGHLARRLALEGHSVRALIRSRAQGSALRAAGIEPFLGDIRDAESLVRPLIGVDVVYHLAASFRAGRASSRELHAANVQGTRNLVEAAAQEGVERFVHCSSVGVHGEVSDPPANESAPLTPGDAYQRSKLEGESEARRAATEKSLPLVIFRPAGIYGPGDLRFLKLVRAAQRPIFPMIGRGEVLYQMVFITDLIEGILLCGRLEAAVGQTYILTGERADTINQIVDTVTGVLGRRPRKVNLPVVPIFLLSAAIEFGCAPLGIEPPLFRRRLDLFRKTRSFDISKAKRELGFEPRTTLEEGFRKTIAWYQEQGLLE